MFKSKSSGKSTVIVGMKLDYEGEIDSNGNACGHGIAKRPEIANSRQPYLEIEGTWLGGMKHGFCKFYFCLS